MRKLWILFALSLFCRFLAAQNPVVNFTATPRLGCAPLVVNFTDVSTGNPTNWDWDLGNGQLSNVRNPVVVYNLPGRYTVKLVVRNANGIAQAIRTNFIEVSPTPNANFFAATTTGCAPSGISFVDQSSGTATSGITGWAWDFGDGGTSAQQNPTHVYTTPGFYDITLRATSAEGCTAVSSRQRYVRIVTGVTANFDQPSPSTCTAPYNLNFNNQSAGPGNLTYNWDFGNGNTSTDRSPAIVYPDAGTFPVRLITVSDYGCSDTLEKTVVFTDNITRFTAPDTVCLNVATGFINSSTPNPVSSKWDFGNGATSASGSPSYTYDSVGIYQVKLINNYGNCIDSISKTLTVGPKPLVDFTAITAASCKAPFIVDFQDLTGNSTNWFWNFGDGSTSTEKNPKHTYTRLGSFDVTLTATFGGGCQNTITKRAFIKVLEPTIEISNVPAGGCIPFTFTPNATVNAVDGIATWLWDFGDGTTSTAAAPTHTYTAVGTYPVKLTVVTTSGCTKTISYPTGVKTGTPLVPDFTADMFDVCASQPVSFTDLTVGADDWLWNFGDGTTDNQKNVVHIFADTGYVNVSLTVFSNRCATTISKPAYIHVLPPIARFNFSVECDNKLRVNFRDSSIIDASLGNLSYTWSFGPSGSLGTATGLTPSLTFPGYGTYPVSLTVTNGTCAPFTFTDTVLLTDERAAFSSSKTSVCKGEEFTLTANPPRPENIKFYEWTIGTNAPILDTSRELKYSIPDGGLYNVRLVIIDTNFCRDTLLLSNYMEVVGPDVDFSPDSRGTCPSSVLTFTDKTTSAAPIAKWNWQYGDGTVTDYTAPPFSHRYTTVGVYSVRLTVTDSRGCESSKFITDTVIVTSPKAGFRADTIYCPGANLNFSDTSSGRNLRYLWNFGNGNTSTIRNPSNSYPAGDQNYTVKLVITDEFGCTDSVTRADYIRIRSPKAAFTVADTTSICPPLEAKFTLGGSDYQSFNWDFGDGSSISSVPNPRHFYNGFNVYTAKLYAIGYGGCMDSTTHNITISDPNSTVLNFDPLQACNLLNVNFRLQAPAYSRLTFFYGDGVVSTSQDTAFSHFYRGPAFFYPNVFLRDSIGCEVLLTQFPAIRVIGAKPLFGADKKQFCDTGNVAFTNFTIYNDTVTAYNWSFGDGMTSNDFAPTHFYSAPGDNVVRLEVITEQGCSDVLLDTIRVYRTPVASIEVTDTICINRHAMFRGRLAVADTNTVNWDWNFGNGQNSTLQNPTVSFVNVGDYQVTLKTTMPFGCTSDTSRMIYVPPAPTVSAGPDQQIISGGGTNIPAVFTGEITDIRWAPSLRLDCTDCPSPYANPTKTTTYNITVTDRYSCVAKDTVTIFVVCGDKNLFVPNTFSPNNDGNNDRFYPRGTGVFMIKSLRVFNRWGETVFENKNFNANASGSGWDGTFKGQRSPQDTYIYTLEIICENSEVSTFKGNITLIR